MLTTRLRRLVPGIATEWAQWLDEWGGTGRGYDLSGREYWGQGGGGVPRGKERLGGRRGIRKKREVCSLGEQHGGSVLAKKGGHNQA